MNNVSENTSAYYHINDSDPNDNKFEIGFVEESVSPEEVSLTSFKNKKGLNSNFWDKNEKLKPKVRKKLLEIADDFYDFVETPWLKIEDILFTGSLCNYNYSKYSDIDIHFLVDLSKYKDKLDILSEYYKMKKKLWASKHEELNIFGYSIELYVQDITNERKKDAGIYSIENNEWVVKPEYKKEGFDKEKVQEKASEIMNNIDEMFDQYEEGKDLNGLLKKAEKQWKKIKDLRKIGLEREGEFSFENIVFKVLRRTKHMEKLLNLRYLIYDNLNSLK